MFDKSTLYIQNKDCNQTNELAYADNTSQQAINFRIRLKQDFPNQYFPKLSSSNRSGFPNSTKIEVSWPKLLYGNNLFEVGASDFASCISQLQTQLAKMGWNIHEEVLKCAYINSQEIALTVNLGDLAVETALLYLSGLKPPHYTMELKCRDYTPGRQIIFRGKKRELTFYAKRQELLAHQAEQYNLDWFWSSADTPKNLLRVEIRIKKAYIKSLLGQKTPILENCFAEQFYQQVIQRNWLPFYKYNKDALVGLSPLDEINLLGDKLTPEQRLDLLAIKTIINTYGFNEAKYQLARMFNWSESEIKQKMALLSKSKTLATVRGEYNFMPFLHNAIINHTTHNKAEQFLEKPTANFAFENYTAKDWWTSSESANYLGVSERHLRRMCQAGKLKHYRVGKLLRLKKEDVIAYQMSRHNR